ncbi:transposase [Candidatus Woesearchaeota archaeon]|nr:transposase [Candidatus Woesearchaeota archaeon]
MQLAIRAEVIGDEDLRKTISLSNQACQECIDIGMREHTFNKTRLHQLTYKVIRTAHPELNSSLVTAVRDQASDMLKRLKLKKKPTKKRDSSIRLNHNTFRLLPDSKLVSLSTIAGRRKYAVKIPPHFEKYEFKSSDSARIRTKKGRTFLDIIIETPTPKRRIVKKIIGIDRGVYNPAVTSDNTFFNSKRLRGVKGRYKHLKRCLQRAGTRSAKRHLQRLAGRERRFVADVNHCISKAIVNKDCDAIAIEELKTGSMKSKGRTGKKTRCLIGSWSARQLLSFIQYKAEMLGKSIILVNSHYTSQACNRCGDIRRTNRKGRIFQCCVCGYSLHADLNASRNIACLAKGRISRLVVNQPNVACDELKASLREELRASIVTSLASQMRGS